MNDDYDKLRAQLELLEWPGVYLFKFIIPNTSENLAKATALFNESSEITLHESKTGKFVSVGAKELMLDVESIINVYKEASQINGLIAL
ncbi:MAG: DUF493 domain-containing protein [Flavobacteriia bacterium]|nr:DUF493 domain-containing protein [Flavobacteriia bacterium]